jgi:heptosyltransferase-2
MRKAGEISSASAAGGGYGETRRSSEEAMSEGGPKLATDSARANAPKAPGRLVILAPNWLGDAIMALPLIADLRRAWPETEIAIAARRSVVPVFEMVPGITHTVTLEGSRGFATFASLRQDARVLAKGGFDAVLLLPNSFRSAWVAARAAIPERWGFARDFRRPLLTRAIARPNHGVHQAAYYQALATGLGLPVGERFAQVTVSGDDKRRARALLAEAGLPSEQPFVVFAPGAAYGRAKRWLPERFAELATLLHAHGLTAVLTGGKSDQRACTDVLKNAAPDVRPVDLCGSTDLLTLAGLLSLSHACVSNDSGAMHLAAAAGTRVVAIFGPTDDTKTSPLRAASDTPEPVIVRTDVWCRPCMLRECPIDHRCMTRISAQAVFAKLDGR